jgi:hypothetical protein
LKPSRQFGLHASGNRHDFDYTHSGAFGCRADAGPTTMVKMPVQKIKMAVIAVAEFIDFPPEQERPAPFKRSGARPSPSCQPRPAKPPTLPFEENKNG